MVRLYAGSRSSVSHLPPNRSSHMRIDNVEISGLFGRFDHSISFNREEPITILHGPNGVGKTTILRLLRDLYLQDLDRVAATAFDSIVIRFERPDGSLRVTPRKDSPREPLCSPQITIAWAYGSRPDTQDPATLLDFVYRKAEGDPQKYTWNPAYFPNVGEIWSTRPDRPSFFLPGDALEPGALSAELEAVGGYSTGPYGDPLRPSSSPPEWLDSVLSSTRIHFIETDRLLADGPRDDRVHNDPQQQQPAVVLLAKQMAERIQGLLSLSAGVAQSRDRSFPSRVLADDTDQEASDDPIRTRYEEQVKKRDRLESAGLLHAEEPIPLPTRVLNDVEKRVLRCYLDDTEEKLAVFDDLLDLLELFIAIINGRFLHKELKITREEGFIVTANDGKHIPLGALSSGEQHELVLANTLLFDTPRESLVLIDEPEISLHVTWQQKFIEDLLRVSRLRGLEFVIATHSPEIIHKWWAFTRSLGGEAND